MKAGGTPLSRPLRSTVLFVLVAASALLYGTRLDEVPIHLHHDEIYFGLLSHSISESLRDPNGRFLPVYFQMGTTHHWYPPLIIYLTAALLKLVGLSDVAVRLPNAAIGAASVLLIYFVARRSFRNDTLALAAAAMLAITPAHFINSRIATDSLYPIVFILLWMLTLFRYLEHPTDRRLFLTASVLGIGVYCYIVAVVMMPIYFLVTLAILWQGRRPIRDMLLAASGFGWPLVFGAAFFVLHPGIVGDFSSKYDLGNSAQLNALQQMREGFTFWNISDRLNLFHSAFAPGYLFVTGGSNVAHSTRQAGVFLAPVAVFLAAGVYDSIRRPTLPLVIAGIGFFTAPLASVLVPEDFVISRMLGLLPFGILLATAGLARICEAPIVRSPRILWAAPAALLVATGAIYVTVMLAGRSHLSWSALALIVAGLVIFAVGRQCERQANWAPAGIVLLILMPIQFVAFYVDYFGDYRARSAARYEYNIRGAIEKMISLRDERGDSPLFLNDDIQFIRAYWEFYLKLHRRTDLLDRARWFDTAGALPDMPPGSLILTDVNPRAMGKLGERKDLLQVGSATDPVDAASPPHERTTFVIFGKP